MKDLTTQSNDIGTKNLFNIGSFKSFNIDFEMDVK